MVDININANKNYQLEELTLKGHCKYRVNFPEGGSFGSGKTLTQSTISISELINTIKDFKTTPALTPSNTILYPDLEYNYFDCKYTVETNHENIDRVTEIINNCDVEFTKYASGALSQDHIEL